MANEYKTGEIYNDTQGDNWTVEADGRLYFADSGVRKTVEFVEGAWGPLKLVEPVSKNIFNVGDVWADVDGDEWRVLGDLDLHCANAVLTHTSEYVERVFGPLRKVSVHISAVPTVHFPNYQDQIDEGREDYKPPSGPTPMWFIQDEINRLHLRANNAQRAGAFPIDFKFDGTAEPAPAEPVKFELEVPPELVARIGESYDTEYLAEATKVYGDALALLVRKSADYGPKNISQSPGGPLNGLRVRMWDKTARLNNLLDSKVSPENESLRDTFVDLLNYSAIALMVLDGNWPGAEPAEGNR